MKCFWGIQTLNSQHGARPGVTHPIHLPLPRDVAPINSRVRESHRGPNLQDSPKN